MKGEVKRHKYEEVKRDGKERIRRKAGRNRMNNADLRIVMVPGNLVPRNNLGYNTVFSQIYLLTTNL